MSRKGEVRWEVRSGNAATFENLAIGQKTLYYINPTGPATWGVVARSLHDGGVLRQQTIPSATTYPGPSVAGLTKNERSVLVFEHDGKYCISDMITGDIQYMPRSLFTIVIPSATQDRFWVVEKRPNLITIRDEVSRDAATADLSRKRLDVNLEWDHDACHWDLDGDAQLLFRLGGASDDPVGRSAHTLLAAPVELQPRRPPWPPYPPPEKLPWVAVTLPPRRPHAPGPRPNRPDFDFGLTEAFNDLDSHQGCQLHVVGDYLVVRHWCDGPLAVLDFWPTW